MPKMNRDLIRVTRTSPVARNQEKKELRRIIFGPESPPGG